MSSTAYAPSGSGASSGGSTSAKQSINTSTAAGWAGIYWILSVIIISVLFFQA